LVTESIEIVPIVFEPMLEQGDGSDEVALEEGP
jgi:hypothetical protein